MNARTTPWFILVLAASCLATGNALFAGAIPPPPPGSQPALPPRTPEQRREDDINRVMEFFRITQPDVYEQAQTLRVTDPIRFTRLILGALPTVNRLETTRQRSQRLFDLSMQDLKLGYQSLRIANDLRRPTLSDAERKRLTDQLTVVVSSEFDVQQKIRQFEIDDLQQKVRDVDTQVKDRERAKLAIIQRRLEDLIERTPRLEW
jgi:hypothetical protein